MYNYTSSDRSPRKKLSGFKWPLDNRVSGLLSSLGSDSWDCDRSAPTTSWSITSVARKGFSDSSTGWLALLSRKEMIYSSNLFPSYKTLGLRGWIKLYALQKDGITKMSFSPSHDIGERALRDWRAHEMSGSGDCSYRFGRRGRPSIFPSFLSPLPLFLFIKVQGAVIKFCLFFLEVHFAVFSLPSCTVHISCSVAHRPVKWQENFWHNLGTELTPSRTWWTIGCNHKFRAFCSLGQNYAQLKCLPSFMLQENLTLEDLTSVTHCNGGSVSRLNRRLHAQRA